MCSDSLTSKQTYLTLRTASAYGGGLIKRLAEAAIDSSHAQRIRLLSAFPEITKSYGPDTIIYKNVLVSENNPTLPKTIRAAAPTSPIIR